jgi:hypothetical protein
VHLWRKPEGGAGVAVNIHRFQKAGETTFVKVCGIRTIKSAGLTGEFKE